VSEAAGQGQRARNIRQAPEHCRRLAVLYRHIPLIPESVMSDPRAADQSRRLNHQGTLARTAAHATVANTAARDDTAAPTWTILWTWLAAVAAAVVILALVYSSDLMRQSGEPAAAGPAAGLAPSAPLSAPQPGDRRAPAPAAPADDDP
jgi:hypothetical protein